MPLLNIPCIAFSIVIIFSYFLVKRNDVLCRICKKKQVKEKQIQERKKN